MGFSVLKSGSFFQPQQVLLMLQSKSVDLAAYFSAEVKDGMFKASVTTRDMAMRLGTLVSFRSATHLYVEAALTTVFGAQNSEM